MAGSAEDWRPAAELGGQIDEAAETWQQGDVLTPGLNMHVGDPAYALTPETAELDEWGLQGVFVEFEAVAIVTQTCDVVRRCSPDTDNRPFIQVSPVVRLSGVELRNADRGRIPRYAQVPGLGDDAFVDLDRCTTLEKSILVRVDQVRGCPDDPSLLAFAGAVARHRSRFAFPDDITEAMSRLTERMVKRADKNSAEGRRVDELTQIRAAATPTWDADHVELEITFVVDSDVLGAVDLEDEVGSDVYDFLTKPHSDERVAAELDRQDLADADRSVLWMELARRWAELVSVGGRVIAVTGTAESEASYSLARLNRSARLDLDHLSAPRSA